METFKKMSILKPKSMCLVKKKNEFIFNPHLIIVFISIYKGENYSIKSCYTLIRQLILLFI